MSYLHAKSNKYFFHNPANKTPCWHIHVTVLLVFTTLFTTYIAYFLGLKVHVLMSKSPTSFTFRLKTHCKSMVRIDPTSPKDNRVIHQYGTRWITPEWVPLKPPDYYSAQSCCGFLEFWFLLRVGGRLPPNSFHYTLARTWRIRFSSLGFVTDRNGDCPVTVARATADNLTRHLIRPLFWSVRLTRTVTVSWWRFLPHTTDNVLWMIFDRQN